MYLKQVAIFAIVAIMLTATCSYAAPVSNKEPLVLTTLFEGESAYYSVRVIENNYGSRFLKCNNHVQTGIKINDPDELLYNYLRSLAASTAFPLQTKSILIGGLGGGSLAGWLAKRFPESRIDIVELDPLIVDLARKFFFFNAPSNVSIHTEDLRVFLRKTERKYDLIILDVFYGDTIPFHLTTREFLSLLKSRLTDGGVVAGHHWALYANEYFHAQIKTYQSVFDELFILGPEDSNSYVFVSPLKGGWIRKEDVTGRAGAMARKRNYNFDPAALLQSEFTNATEMPVEAMVLTDDHAPVNIMSVRPKEKTRTGPIEKTGAGHE